MDEKQTRFYRMTAGQAEEYAVPGEEIKELTRGCERSEFQFLTREPLQADLSEDSGLEFPDFLCRFQIPLISDEFKKMGYNIDKKCIKLDHPLDSLGVHEVTIELHKKVVIKYSVTLTK